MRRIAIIGCGGAGKTSLARNLGERLGIPVHHLDAMFWKPGWQPVERPVFAAAQREIVASPAWVIDGNYGGTMEIRLAAADTIVFMDLSRAACLWGALKRRIQQKPGPDKDPRNRERLTLEYLRWIWGYRSSRRPGILRRLKELGDEKTVVILRSRRDVDRFLER